MCNEDITEHMAIYEKDEAKVQILKRCRKFSEQNLIMKTASIADPTTYAKHIVLILEWNIISRGQPASFQATQQEPVENVMQMQALSVQYLSIFFSR